MEAIGIAFDDAIVAGDIGSYKPAPRHWQVFREQHGGDIEHVHVAQSLFHDIAPTTSSGSPTSGSTGSAGARGRASDRMLESLPASRTRSTSSSRTGAIVATIARRRSRTAPDGGAAERDQRRAVGHDELTDAEVRSWYAHDELDVQLAERDGESSGTATVGASRSVTGRGSTCRSGATPRRAERSCASWRLGLRRTSTRARSR